MAGSMHEQFERVYHMALRIILAPLWRAPVVGFAAGLVARLLGPGRAGLGAALAVLAGWLALVLPLNPFLANGPVARLPGAAVLLAVYAQAGRGAGPLPGWLVLPLYAAAAGWWLRGAPFDGAGVANLVPVVLGLWAASALARWLARGDAGVTSVAAAVALGGGVALAGMAPPWVDAALVPATAGLALLGRSEAATVLAQAIVLVATAAVAASNRGRFAPVDLSAAAPFVVWVLAPRLLPRLNRAGPALAASLAAVCGVALVWGGIALLAHR
jgi:hypothetical protein